MKDSEKPKAESRKRKANAPSAFRFPLSAFTEAFTIF